jgi:hypothetical protein
VADGQAKIIVGASEVAGDRRHTYLLFERADGSRTVVRGGPDGRSEGNDLANFAESTVLGSNKFGNIRVDSSPYEPPYEAVYRREKNGSLTPLHADRADINDPSLVRDANGQPITQEHVSPDWPGPNEHHERLTVWNGSDAELDEKLHAALEAAQQINNAKLEYSPLNNNSNGVTSNLLKTVDIKPDLPTDKNGEKVRAPDFGEDLYKDVGLASHRSGNRFDGKQWCNDDGQKIKPPQGDGPTVPIEAGNKPSKGSFDSGSTPEHHDAANRHAGSDMRDPTHRDHAMYVQAYQHVTQIDRGMGRTPDEHSERLAAAVTAQSKADGLDTIHHIVMNDDRSRAFAVDTQDISAPWSRRSSVDVATAVQQTVEVSNGKLQETNTQLVAEQSKQHDMTPGETAIASPRLV